jgi:HD-like signal output (HDOD) protein
VRDVREQSENQSHRQQTHAQPTCHPRINTVKVLLGLRRLRHRSRLASAVQSGRETSDISDMALRSSLDSRLPRQRQAERASLPDQVSARLTRLETLPVDRSVALRLLHVIDDPMASNATIAGVVERDPALVARLMQVANSAYYGMRGRVRTLPLAVSVLGHVTLRSMAVVAAAELASASLPEGFWLESLAVAALARELAVEIGAIEEEAFGAGLLTDLGMAILAAVDEAYRWDLTASERLDWERERYGISHVGITRQLLAAWSFPSGVCDAIAAHHDEPVPGGDPLAVSVQLASRIVAGGRLADTDPVTTRLIDAARIEPMRERAKAAAADLAPALA